MINVQTALACKLFSGIGADDFLALSGCLDIREKRYASGDYIVFAGKAPQGIGVVLAGQAHVIQQDYWGNRSIIGHLAESDVFAESFVCAGEPVMPVSVVATAACEVLFLNFERVINSCSNNCRFHQQLIRNMLGIVASKSVALTRKLEDISQRSTRDKLLSYFSRQAKEHGAHFSIPFNRQELADYLGVDRSALSAVLGTLAREGFIRYRKNDFWLLQERPS